jgi:hypothetical protein
MSENLKANITDVAITTAKIDSGGLSGSKISDLSIDNSSIVSGIIHEKDKLDSKYDSEAYIINLKNIGVSMEMVKDNLFIKLENKNTKNNKRNGD